MSETETIIRQTNRYNENGKKEGLIEVHYRNGVVKSRGQFSNGKKEGLFQTFNLEGFMTQEGNYKQNKKIGEWNVFYPPEKSTTPKNS